MGAIIRQFRMEDYDAVAALWESAGIRVDSREDLAFKLRRDPELFVLAEDQGRIVGVLLGAFDGRLGSINRLAVAEAYRRSGLASRLIEAVEERLIELGARRVWAWIEPENDASRALFARSGYEEWAGVVTVSKGLTPRQR